MPEGLIGRLVAKRHGYLSEFTIQRLDPINQRIPLRRSGGRLRQLPATSVQHPHERRRHGFQRSGHRLASRLQVSGSLRRFRSLLKHRVGKGCTACVVTTLCAEAIQRP